MRFRRRGAQEKNGLPDLAWPWGGPGPAWKAHPDIFINCEARMKFLGKCPPTQKVAFRVDETIGCDNTIRKWWARLTSYFENLSIC